MHYLLLNGCPAVTVPVRPGCPLISWDALTLDELHKIGAKNINGKKFNGIVNVLFEYVSFCIDWDRVILPPEYAKEEGNDQKSKEDAVKEAIGLVVAGAVQSYESTEVKKKVDSDRAGIVMLRMP